MYLKKASNMLSTISPLTPYPPYGYKAYRKGGIPIEVNLHRGDRGIAGFQGVFARHVPTHHACSARLLDLI